jgi:tetratricopeptide (TPR) repeat protein
MSLVNEVLRQLDNRSSLPVNSMPLQALMVSNDKKSVNYFKIIFFLLITILASIITVQLFFDVPLTNLLFHQQTTEKTVIKIAPQSEAIALPTIEIEAISVTPSVLAKNLESKSIETKSSEASHAVIATIVEVVAEDTQSLDSEATQLSDEIVQIQRIEVPGLKQYQLALKSYKKNESAMALHWVNLAIELEAIEKYQLLKARIYLQQKDGESFYNLVLQQANNHSLSWHRLVAPGLQIFSYHDLSNKYYTQLIKQQPQLVKWQLAMALNYSKLEEFDKTKALYQSLLQSSLLSTKQRQWLVSQARRLNENKVVVNGS